MPHPNDNILSRAHRIFLYLGIAYASLVVLLAIPFFQLHAVYLHALKWPLFAKFHLPEKYGIAPGKTLNFKLTTSDNETIGAWFMLSDTYYHSIPSPVDPSILPIHYIRPALQSNPTILFLHGNAATRAVSFRIEHYALFTSRLRANVLAIDYRGFGDSSGTPSEEGLVKDARAAYEWLRERGAKGEDVIVMGHSLGTGVSTAFVKGLEDEGETVRGIVLLAPFQSLRKVLDTYLVLGFFPLMKPLRSIPAAANFVLGFLAHQFDTSSIIADIKAPIVLAHAENDWDIPYTHSETLFNAILEPLLPPLPDMPQTVSDLTKDDWAAYTSTQAVRQKMRDELVGQTQIQNFGTVEEILRGSEGKVVFVKTRWGGHDRIGLQEGVQDIIGRTFGML